MIDPNREPIISLSAAARLPCLRVNGRPRHIATLYRWFQNGRRGVYLETLLIGGIRGTSAAAVGRFLAQSNASPTPSCRTSAQRQRAIAQAEAGLASNGIQ